MDDRAAPAQELECNILSKSTELGQHCTGFLVDDCCGPQTLHFMIGEIAKTSSFKSRKNVRLVALLVYHISNVSHVGKLLSYLIYVDPPSSCEMQGVHIPGSLLLEVSPKSEHGSREIRILICTN